MKRMLSNVNVTEQPRVSVCLASYNGEKFIREQIESILSELNQLDEIIVCDDGSSDATCSVVQSINDPRITLISNTKNIGHVKNFEKVLSLAKGDFIFLSDQDDIWEQNKVSVMTKYLNKYDMVISDARLINADGKIMNDSLYKFRNTGPGFLKNLFKNTYTGCCMAFNRKILEKSLPFPAAVPMHDIWLGMIAELFGTVYFCSEKLVCHRRHASNASPTGGKSCYSLYDKLKFRYNLLYELAKRYLQIQGRLVGL